MQIHMNHEKGEVSLDQERYIEIMLEKYNMQNSYPVRTPGEAGLRLSTKHQPGTQEETEEMTRKPYRQLVGSLNFASTCTRPDIAASTSEVGTFLENPGNTHWGAAKRILRYLKGSRKNKLVYKNTDGPTTLVGYTDSDWAGDVDKRRSRTGYIFYLSGAPVSWSSRLQKCAALSSCEAEYVAACAATQEAMWLRGFLEELGFPQTGPTTILEDNQGTICVSEREGDNERTKHIDIKYHYTRERVAEGDVKLKYIPTKKNTADILTKPLQMATFEELMKLMGDSEKPFRDSGGVTEIYLSQ
jgi:hypothetical protein